MEKAHLPELKSSFGYRTCILSATPSDPNCRVIFFDSSDKCASFCQPGDVEYIKQELDDDYMPFAATTFKGKGINRAAMFGNARRGYMQVLRAEFSKMEWVEIESIGQRTIFLDNNSGMASSSVEAGTRSNCIYFVDFRDKNLYVFDMEDRSITTLLPCPNVSRHDSLPCWIWL
ncbi:hypothetical protein U1Q18_014012 [Sarracenia purpurea var. burkii]